MALLLVVDDDPLVRQLLRRLLTDRGYAVREATGVTGASEQLGSEPFELVLCAIDMAEESGLSLVRQIRDGLPRTGVMMVTTVDDPQLAEEALALGAYGYVVKPFRANELLINVSSALRRVELERARRTHLQELEAKLLTRGAALRQALNRLAESESDVESVERETVDRLVAALTLGTEETGEHLQRMSRYAEILAGLHGIDDWTPDEFRIAALLHDVGKIGIPDAILRKPGRLTADEFAAIRRHPDLGVGLLGEASSRILRLGARIVLNHHERWDGSGYPGGLSGAEIPIEGRVAAIADVFDALTSDRVHRPAFGINEAVEMMLVQRGRRFDPELMDLFEDCLPDLLVIRDQHPDPPPTADIQVALVNAGRRFGDALACALSSSGEIAVVGTATTADEAKALLATRAVDVLVIDADLPDLSGAELARGLAVTYPDTALILLVPRDDDTAILAALDVGFAGVVVRDRAFDDLAPAIATANRGEPVVPAGRLIAMLNRRRIGAAATRLTRRETEVLLVMAEGLSNEAIAGRLVVSLNTVRTHTQRILIKLSAHSKLEAVAEAGRRGLLP